jgi:tetratricopeptide (TPR) repeat protein
MGFRKTLTFFMLVMGLVIALSAWAQQKPMTQDQVQALVRDGFGDESGAKLVEQRGIDFAPSDNFMQTLKAAGASEAFLDAVRGAKRSKPASAKKPINQLQVITLLAGQVPSHRVGMLVQERGIDFAPTDDYLQQVRLAGGDDELISALKAAEVTKPENVDPALQAQRAEIRQYVVRATELSMKGHYAEAEQEYRAALRVDSQNDDLYVGLAFVLIEQMKSDDAASAAREALRLNPSNDMAHANLGAALAGKGNTDGAVAEYREALRLNPNNAQAHFSIGMVLANKGDTDGAIVESREAVRLNPGIATAHALLGLCLALKGDPQASLDQCRIANGLAPDNAFVRKECNDQNMAQAHLALANAFVQKQDIDGAIKESREALRLNPNLAEAHAMLGVCLAGKGDGQAGLEQCRIAQELAPDNTQVHSVCKLLAEGLKTAMPTKTEETTTASTPTAPPCAVPFTWAIMDWEDSQKMRWGFPEDGVYWWSSKGVSKFPNLCFTQPDSASYVIVVRTRHFPVVNRGGDFEIEVFHLLHGEINAYPILWRSKFNDSIKLKFEQSVKYLDEHHGE